jgi:hypothetical protein
LPAVSAWAYTAESGEKRRGNRDTVGGDEQDDMSETEPQAAASKPERRFQYSLRTLFGLTSVTAVFFSAACTFGYDDALLALVEFLVLLGIITFCRDSTMTARSVWRPVMYGAFAGVAIGSLLMIAGWTSPDPATCFLQCIAIVGGGIGCGVAVDLAVALRAQTRDTSSHNSPTVGWLLAGTLAGIPAYWVLVPWYTCDMVFGYKLQTAEHIIWGSIFGAIGGAVVDILINLRRGRFRGWRFRFSLWTLLLLSIIVVAVYGIARMCIRMEGVR